MIQPTNGLTSDTIILIVTDPAGHETEYTLLDENEAERLAYTMDCTDFTTHEDAGGYYCTASSID